jgi:hypothetical protein
MTNLRFRPNQQTAGDKTLEAAGEDVEVANASQSLAGVCALPGPGIVRRQGHATQYAVCFPVKK